MFDNTNIHKCEGTIWWYEAWDASWRQYSCRMITDIEFHYRANASNVRIFETTYRKKTLHFIVGCAGQRSR
jgi:hypothetical protein